MSDHPTELGGTCSARFDPLRELFAAKLESGEDLGASLAFNIDGEMIVDLWGGWADLARTVPWTENTITNVFSTTKSMNRQAAASECSTTCYLEGCCRVQVLSPLSRSTTTFANSKTPSNVLGMLPECVQRRAEPEAFLSALCHSTCHRRRGS
jgi:hypothetical protein